VLGNMNEREGLVELICDGGAFTHPWSPNWQDHSTQVECEEFENAVGGPEALASITGSRAHHVLSPPQFFPFFVVDRFVDIGSSHSVSRDRKYPASVNVSPRFTKTHVGFLSFLHFYVLYF
jgi:hypothetical protein